MMALQKDRVRPSRETLTTQRFGATIQKIGSH